jgi:methyltransferase (TIGR00027 family)
MTQPVIAHINDTAHWVATYRALETARPDALFRDPLAERLSGERGRAIAAVAPRQARNGWPVIVRTKLLDDLIMACVADGCDCVVNLAAGFDTRPYRLALPSTLRFIEADLPALLAEKERLLAGEQPVCELRRVPIDLTDASARGAFLDAALRGSRKALVITEGLLCYLDDALVTSLSADLMARPAVHWWIFDMFSPAVDVCWTAAWARSWRRRR